MENCIKDGTLLVSLLDLRGILLNLPGVDVVENLRGFM